VVIRGTQGFEGVSESPFSKAGEKGLRFVVSHISRKTSEIWGTPRSVEGKETADPSASLGMTKRRAVRLYREQPQQGILDFLLCGKEL
jgi:hypothetical protein